MDLDNVRINIGRGFLKKGQFSYMLVGMDFLTAEGGSAITGSARCANSSAYSTRYFSAALQRSLSRVGVRNIVGLTPFPK